MKNKELATAARELVKEKWASEKRIDPTAKFEYAAASVAASIQADAKELARIGETERALDIMNMVSVIMIDLAGVTFNSPGHQAVALVRFEKNYGQPYTGKPTRVMLRKTVIGYKLGMDLGMPIGEHTAITLYNEIEDGRLLGSSAGYDVLIKPEEVRMVCA